MTAPVAPPPSRQTKFERVLSKLVLDRPVFTRSQPITVFVDPPIDELCDVTLRLTHSSGRTYAEARVELNPDTRSVGLGLALNLPGGAYDIIATPPLAEFFSTTPVERRLSCQVAASTFVETPSGSYAERRSEILREAELHGPAAIAQLALEDGGTAAPRKLLNHLVGQGAPGLAVAAAAYLDGGPRGHVETLMVDLATQGLDLAGPAPEATIAALAALIDGAEGHVAELATVVLDKLIFCLALSCSRGISGTAAPSPAFTARTDSLSPLTRLLWGVGGFDGDVTAALALALARGYEVPALLQAIALDDTEGASFQRHSDGEARATAELTNWRCGGAMLSSSRRNWLAMLGPDARVFASAEAETIVHRDATLAARYRPAAAGTLHIAFPFWAFDETSLATRWVIGRTGERYVAVHASNGLERPREQAAATLLSPAAGNLLVCHLGDASADGGFEAFQARVSALAISVGAAGFVAETLRGAPLSETDGRPFPPGAHIRSAYCRADAGETALEIRFGEDGLRADFSPRGEASEGEFQR